MKNGKPRTPTIREEQEEQDAADDRADALDAEPVGDAQVTRVAGQREPFLGLLAERRAGHAARCVRRSWLASGRSVRSMNGC